METNDLRARIRAGAVSMLAERHIWPNGLGFEWRGWEYTISEPDGRWCAYHRKSGRHGKDEGPVLARLAAKPLA